MPKFSSFFSLARDNGLISAFQYGVARYITHKEEDGFLPGTASKRREPPIIVTTSACSADLSYVEPMLKSVMRQLFKPDKIVLWLSEAEFAADLTVVPDSIRFFQKFGLEIRFCPTSQLACCGLASALSEHPEAVIITLDSKREFSNDVIERLYESYLAHPHAVSALNAHMITIDADGKPRPYRDWIFGVSAFYGMPRMDLIAASSSGAIYPPHCMKYSAFNDADAMLVKGFEDIWFKHAQAAVGTPVVLVQPRNKSLNEAVLPDWGIWDSVFDCLDDLDARMSSILRACASRFVQLDSSVSGAWGTCSEVRSSLPARVLFVTGDGCHTGATLSSLTLAGLLREKGIDPLIVFPEEGDAMDEANRMGLRWVLIPAARWVQEFDRKITETEDYSFLRKLNGRAANAIASVILQEGVDLVHTCTISIGVGSQAASKTGCKTVWHAREFLQEDHGQEFWDESESLNALRNCDRIICISQSIYDKYSQLVGDSHRCTLVYNGLDVQRYLRKDRRILEKDVITIIISGRVEEGKSQLDLVRAVSLLGDAAKNVLVLMIGQQPFIEDPDSYCNIVRKTIDELGISDHIMLTGAVPNMEDYWEEADIAVTCSRFEAFGRVTVEAMLAGCYVIGANTAGTAEIVLDGETGALYEAGNPSALAASINHAIEHADESRAIASNARDVAQRVYNAERNAEEVFGVYCEVFNT